MKKSFIQQETQGWWMLNVVDLKFILLKMQLTFHDDEPETGVFYHFIVIKHRFYNPFCFSKVNF